MTALQLADGGPYPVSGSAGMLASGPHTAGRDHFDRDHFDRDHFDREQEVTW